ncbi:MAG: relaxase/mobilization nuclease domain-containing protein [Geobacteraceae bacterium]|nr:relaxase/mobilization nuclease domain-containing protein [Geobacteraceae bacterium]
MANLIDDTIADLLEGSVKFKREKGTGSLRNRISRVAHQAPEVLIKISGNSTGTGHTLAHLEYISRHGKVELETEQGEILKGKETVRQLHKDWTQDSGKRKKNTRETTNIVLSMPAGTDAPSVKNAARDFARIQFGANYQYVLAQHTDAQHPHVHLTVKNLGFNGRRLHVRKGDPQKWRELFAEQLQRRGVEAEATPRAVRGVIRKSVKQVIRHIRDKGEIPAVEKSKVKQILEEARSENQDGPSIARPWEDKIKLRQTQVRKGWLSVAKVLHHSPDTQDKDLSKNIIAFVNKMPPMKTERHEIKERLAGQIQARQTENVQEER